MSLTIQRDKQMPQLVKRGKWVFAGCRGKRRNITIPPSLSEYGFQPR